MPNRMAQQYQKRCQRPAGFSHQAQSHRSQKSKHEKKFDVHSKFIEDDGKPHLELGWVLNSSPACVAARVVYPSQPAHGDMPPPGCSLFVCGHTPATRMGTVFIHKGKAIHLATGSNITHILTMAYLASCRWCRHQQNCPPTYSPREQC